ncbi:diphthamide biosynthesis protein 3 [Heterostelium album PN500]|uniref:Diphthamide biosynthesis protein 3 n=1 Tax=Heterostelium pallidum (strain ATCC 26659 / Pp 5 / PN500) TaxID=670386 RepID=D3BAS3_HETP5|nr:diphthamide biosynthesis protein 3 [Heterostelium album PN500]EFA81660.1 diphthamide biosynthesis protein 3 [Heterostelium album PN500]|eukprot:XP_020433777.1 diphthamide biosynthesis protein 3 [Heterostelium album PN500]
MSDTEKDNKVENTDDAASSSTETTNSTTKTETTTTTATADDKKIVYVKNNAVIDVNVTSFYDEIEIEDMDFDEDERVFYYPCPCGDRFKITEEEILAGEEIAKCPSCSLLLKVVYSPEDFIVEDDLGDSAITVA